MILSTSLFALYVQKHPHKIWAIRTYTSLLFFWILIFVFAPWYGRTQADWVVQTINDNCENKVLYAVDGVYRFANSQLCQPDCPCFANSSDWQVLLDNKTRPRSLLEAKLDDTALLATAVMDATNYNLSKNYQSCPLIDTLANQNQSEKIANAVGIADFGFDALGAVENDFSCSNMCGDPFLYSFSDVRRGLPH